MQEYFLKERLSKVDKDFLEHELQFANKKDKEKIMALVKAKQKLPNPYNSILLYVTGVSDEFDFNLGRSKNIGGSPPD